MSASHISHEASSSSVSEALSAEVKEESKEMPDVKSKEESRSDEAEEKTEVDPSDSDVEEKTAGTNQADVKDDGDEDKVML